MSPEKRAALLQLEADRKRAQDRLYQLFLSTPMTVGEFKRREDYINTKFAREEALIILEAIMQTELSR